MAWVVPSRVSIWLRLFSPFARLHARGAALVYLGLRVFAVFVFSMASVPFAEWVRGDTLLTFVALTMVLAELELRRTGTTTLYDNIGVGMPLRAVLAAAPALVAEVALLAVWPRG